MTKQNILVCTGLLAAGSVGAVVIYCQAVRFDSNSDLDLAASGEPGAVPMETRSGKRDAELGGEVTIETLLADGNVDGALTLLENHRGSVKFEKALEEVIALGTRHDWRAILDWVTTDLAGDRQTNAILKMASVLGEIDPQAGIALTEILPSNPELRLSAIDAIARSWGTREPQKVMQWLMSNSDIVGSGERRIALSSIGPTLEALADKAPLELVAWAEGLKSSELTWTVRTAAVLALVVRDSEAAFALVSRLPLGELEERRSTRMIGGLYSRWASIDPSSALSHLRNANISDRDARHFQSKLFFGWSLSDPEAAAKEISKDPESVDMMSTAAVAGQYLEVDPLMASKWIISLPYGEIRDGAISQILGQIRETDPVAAFEWSTNLSSEDPSRAKNRIFHLKHNVRSLKASTSTEELIDLIGAAQLSADERAMLTEMILAPPA